MSFHIRLFVWKEKYRGEQMRHQADSWSFGIIQIWPTDQTGQMRSASIKQSSKEKECLAKL